VSPLRRHPLKASVAAVRGALPEGRHLPDDIWERRHRVLVVLVLAHAAVLGAIGAISEDDPSHGLLEAVPLIAFAAIASTRAVPHWLRAAAVATGLLTASALTVHVFDGVIEAHFHFFVVVGLLTLYQHWAPFLLAITYVVVHHGFLGGLVPESVFNHQPAQERPWLWAGVHGAFVLASSATALVAWRFNEEVQREVIRREEQLRTFTRHGSDLVVVVETDDTIRSAADSITRILGWRPDQVVGRNGFDFVHPEDHAIAAAMTGGMRDEPGAYQHAELRMLHADGSYRLMYATAINLIMDPDVAGIIFTAHDITARRRAEEAVRQSEQRFRALVQNGTDVIAVLERDGSLRFASPAVERILGYQPAIGESVFDLIHPDDRNGIGEAFADALDTPGITMPAEFRLRAVDGTWREVEAVANNLLDDVSVAGVVVNVRDVTERKAAERSLREAEERVRESHLKQRQALEINDNVVQGLAVAKYAFEMGRTDLGAAALDRTLAAAREIISGLLIEADGSLEAGDLARERAASVLNG
jgi:PAS domain S-box-containing protein